MTQAFALPLAKASSGVWKMSVYITGVVVMENIKYYYFPGVVVMENIKY